MNACIITTPDSIRHTIILEIVMKCLKLQYCMWCICACCTILFFLFFVVFSLFSCIAFYRLWWVKMNKMRHLAVSLSIMLRDNNEASIIISYTFLTKIKLCMPIQSARLFSGFFELAFGYTAQKLSRNSWSISADIGLEVARVHLQQLILVTCIIMSRGEQFLCDTAA